MLFKASDLTPGEYIEIMSRYATGDELTTADALGQRFFIYMEALQSFTGSKQRVPLMIDSIVSKSVVLVR